MADQVVELEFADSISLETVRQMLKKTNSSPGRRKSGCIPKVSGEFVARMEDVLDLYQPAYHPERPVVCFDETSRQTRPLPAIDWGGGVRPWRLPRDGWHAMTPSTSATGHGTCS